MVGNRCTECGTPMNEVPFGKCVTHAAAVEDAQPAASVEPWGYGWYQNGGRKMASGYLPTIDYPRSENVSEGPFPLYRAAPPADGVLREVLIEARRWVEANTASVRGLSSEAAKPGEAMLQKIDTALAAAPKATTAPIRETGENK